MKSHSAAARVSKFFIIFGIFVLVAVPLIWGLKGASRGWSATRVMTIHIDPVTEMEFPKWENRLVLGIDFLGAGIFGGLLFLGAGLALQKAACRRAPFAR
jgi:hypothetical protein